MIAVTGAKYNSKRFPGKNLAPLRGKPLIEYTIDFVKRLRMPHYIVTRDKEIMDHVGDRLPILYEPQWLWEMEGSTEELVDWIRDVTGEHIIVLLQATCPIRDLSQTIEWIIDFMETDCHKGVSVFNGKQNGAFYIYRRAGNGTREYRDTQDFDIDYPDDLKRVEEWLLTS